MVETHRIFVALWPSEDVRQRLAEVAARIAARVPHGRPVRAANLHLTLAFIGSLRMDRITAIAEQIERCKAEPFVWTVDRFGVFPRAHVVWAGGAPNTALDDLAAAARARLDGLRIDFDRKPFAAHVTLLRNVVRLPDGCPLIDPPIRWICDRASLVRSESGPGGSTYVLLTPG